MGADRIWPPKQSIRAFSHTFVATTETCVQAPVQLNTNSFARQRQIILPTEQRNCIVQ